MSSSERGLMLVVGSVLLEPVIDVDLEVDVVSEVTWSSRSNMIMRSIGHQVSSLHLEVLSSIVFAQETKASLDSA